MSRRGSISDPLLSPRTRSGWVSWSSSSLNRKAGKSPIQPSVFTSTNSLELTSFSFKRTINRVSLSGTDDGLVSPMKKAVSCRKSSLCTFLANMCVQNGLKVGVVDADVGQADIGPPTTISSSLASEPILTLQDLRQETAFFIGDTSPSSVPDKLTRLIVRLKEKLVSSSELVLVNTDGWIGDLPALRFKEELLHETQPDLVLGLSRGSEIDPLLDMVSSASIRLPSSTYARMRSREERKSARETGYRRFLLGSKTMKISQENTKLRMFDRSEQQVLRWDRKLKGFLAGLLDDHQELLGIGRIREMIDGYALVETKTTERPRFLEIGNILLSSKYEEIGYGMLH